MKALPFFQAPASSSVSGSGDAGEPQISAGEDPDASRQFWKALPFFQASASSSVSGSGDAGEPQLSAGEDPDTSRQFWKALPFFQAQASSSVSGSGDAGEPQISAGEDPDTSSAEPKGCSASMNQELKKGAAVKGEQSLPPPRKEGELDPVSVSAQAGISFRRS